MGACCGSKEATVTPNFVDIDKQKEFPPIANDSARDEVHESAPTVKVEFDGNLIDLENLGQHVKPQLDYVVECFLKCPDECTKLKCGKCLVDHCNNTAYAIERCEEVIKSLKDNGLKNSFTIKAWGCLHPDIDQDLLKMSVKPEEVPTPIAEKPVRVISSHNSIDLLSEL
jgi:hypothetical protein